MSYHAPYFFWDRDFLLGINLALTGRDFMRLGLALAASVLFHAFLALTWTSFARMDKAGQGVGKSPRLNVVLVTAPRPRNEGAPKETTSKRPTDLFARNVQERPKQKPTETVEHKAETPIAAPQETEGESIQSLGVALNQMAFNQYMMMRVKQFYSVARASANGVIKSRFTPDEFARYQGKRCTLRMEVVPSPEQGYQLARAECDDPGLTAELQALTWSTAIPRPSDYSLPYRGLIINISVGSYDVAIGLEPIVN